MVSCRQLALIPITQSSGHVFNLQPAMLRCDVQGVDFQGNAGLLWHGWQAAGRLSVACRGMVPCAKNGHRRPGFGIGEREWGAAHGLVACRKSSVGIGGRDVRVSLLTHGERGLPCPRDAETPPAGSVAPRRHPGADVCIPMAMESGYRTGWGGMEWDPTGCGAWDASGEPGEVFQGIA
ncbi:hypothetical protein RR42_s1379 [Cupriavidus basilensis]|uniref:Uncharacterized protein n=1 Tax=Cupriavidus basilensis TaxID=68895 RepID=A0A0C4YBK5_9BURK|nr:hypothetical protein RR42_s1379 [Cupriavidus basilensis]